MTFLELILLILILFALIAVVGAALHCRGKATIGPSEVPDHGVIHVRVSGVTCRSFTVQFETTSPVTEASGTIELTDDIVQTVSASYSSPQTQHELTFSNGQVGLAKDRWYSYSIMGRDSFDHDPEAGIEPPFLCRTAKCCLDKLWPSFLKILEIKSWLGPAQRR